MKFEFTDEHEALRSLLREVCAEVGNARAVYNSDATLDARLWSALGTSGLLGVGGPEAYDGGGAGPVEQVLIAEGLGRVAGAVPFSEHAAAGDTIARLGSEGQCKRLLIPLNRAEQVAGIVSPTKSNLAAISVRSDRDGWRLDGRLPLIPNAAAATILLVPAVIDDRLRWLVTGNAQITALATVDRTRPAAAAEFSGTAAEILAVDETPDRPTELLWTLAAAEAVGAASTALDSTARYTTERHQFGLPIGTFQAVKHRLADMLVAVENSRSVVYAAAWALAEDGRAGRAAPLAQAVATGYAIEVVSTAVQLHGGIGVTWECDLHLYLRRAKALELTYGSPAEHRARIAASLLDA
ncbi:acyl-CoA dehydrogenase family protein [Mycolicibacter sinensis]|uniref:Acyl-CoA dehydrogenase n=1 Tax=Mycolicibacter sinensis (strain JDM601) TaxID=875328 RepID=A0A1A3U0N9_MYCSD|nr:acyl-CoA dehydrogenase family protein [Mycolicibacter sinensis]OBK88436.1 hypothetical protein A5648_01155 [Mycolicibacter sinensis]